MGNLELLEKAFSIAESGKVANLNELRRKLLEDGAPLAELEQFHGRALARQLCGKIALSKKRNPRQENRPAMRADAGLSSSCSPQE